MKFTKEQMKRWNEKAGNGFKLDVTHAVMWGDKVLHKFIELGDGKILEARLLYIEQHDIREDRCYTPIMSLVKWHKEENMLASSDRGKRINIGVAVIRRNFNKLLEYSRNDEFDDATLIKLYSE